MLGDLFKQLGVGLWRFFRYHLTGYRGAPRAAQPADYSNPMFAPANAERLTVSSDAGTLSETYKISVRLSTNRRDVDTEEFALSPMYQCWKKQPKPRAHKWTHYFEVYEAIFGPRRHLALRILEIGVFKGSSLRLWREYFESPDTVIVGIDIDPTCARFDSPQENVHVRIGSQADTGFLDAVVREFGPFDIILDDGSHHSSHMIASFNRLFAGGLKDDGIYVAEDLHANYWLPWRDTQLSFLDFCKQLMEYMHAAYTVATVADWFRESETDAGPLVLDVPVIAAMVKEIRVFDSVVAIYKARREHLTRVLNPMAD